MKKYMWLFSTVLACLCLSCNQYTQNEKEVTKTDATLQELSKLENNEQYQTIIENTFQSAAKHPLSTFSIDVDRAAYSNIRRFLQQDQLPPKDAVRIEEMINYFNYEYPTPTDEKPFAVYSATSTCPWNPAHQLLHIGLQGKKINPTNLPNSNIVFLIDVSGSMADANKLPLVKQSMHLLAKQLKATDKVAIVTYAGNESLVLPATKGSEQERIHEAIEHLESGGGTAGAKGITLAYQIATEHFQQNGNYRIVLCTDGDFNIGPSSDEALVQLIEEKRKTGIYLSVLGFGMGNYKDGKMQLLADKGNGNHAYIDQLEEAKKVLVAEFTGTMYTIAKDVKIQINFNTQFVQAYRLIGYENRQLATEDFANDQKDAGEMGAGHTVTALYEIIPVGVQDAFSHPQPNSPEQKAAGRMPANALANIQLRYKLPNSDESSSMNHTVIANTIPIEQASNNTQLAAALAEFGMLLFQSDYRQKSSYEQAKHLAKQSLQEDKEGYIKELISLMEKAQQLQKK